ncbi:MAG: hypothetical protein QM820_55360 [Minicystis sp.]
MAIARIEDLGNSVNRLSDLEEAIAQEMQSASEDSSDVALLRKAQARVEDARHALSRRK